MHRVIGKQSWPMAALSNGPNDGVLGWRLWILVLLVAVGGCRSHPATPAAVTPPPPATVEQLRARLETNQDAAAGRELAYRSLQAGDLAAAKQYVEQSLALDANSSDGHNIQGMVYAQRGNPVLAETCFKQAGRLAPEKAGPDLNLGRLYLGLQRYPLAARAFERAQKKDPNSLQAALLAGEAWMKAGSSIAAKLQYRKALKLDPRQAGAHAALGQLLINGGRFVEARKHLEKARELGDDSPATEGYLGMAYAIGIQTDEDIQRALKHLDHAYKAGERGSQMYYGLGFAHLAAKDYPGAERLLREGLQRYPDVAGLYYTLADVYAATGRYEKARLAREKSARLAELREREKKFQQAIIAAPGQAAPRLAYARWLLKRGDYARAEDQFRQALAADPQSAEARRGLAKATAALRKKS